MKRLKGTLYLIGGAADTSLKRFAELALGKKGTVVLLPHASSDPGGAAADTEKALRGYGVGNVITILPGSRDLPPAETTAIFMSGGDQSRLVSDLPTALKEAIHAFLDAGGLVGGTSAGAAAVSQTMIAGGMGTEAWPDAATLLLEPGLGLLPGFIVDTHVHERKRPDRLMVALSLVKNVRGIGLDNDTAVEIHGRTAVVHGSGLARVYSRSSQFRGQPSGTRKACVRNVISSIIPEGESFAV